MLTVISRPILKPAARLIELAIPLAMTSGRALSGFGPAGCGRPFLLDDILDLADRITLLILDSSFDPVRLLHGIYLSHYSPPIFFTVLHFYIGSCFRDGRNNLFNL